MTLHAPTPGELAAQRHDLVDEADADLQDALHHLAARSGPPTTWQRIRRQIHPKGTR